MKKYKITIVHDSLSDILILMDIIDRFCMRAVDVCYFVGSSRAMHHLKNSEADIVIINKNLYPLLKSGKYLQAEDTVIILLNATQFIESDNRKIIYGIQFPFKIENVLLTINNVYKELINLLPSNKSENYENSLVTVFSTERTDVIEVKNIAFCSADGRYTYINLKNGRKILSCRNLGEYERQLAHKEFFRIHHGYIINVNHLKRINKSKGFYCEMHNEAILPISKRKVALFTKYLRGFSRPLRIELT